MAMGADYSFELISFETYAPQFFGLNKFFLCSVGRWVVGTGPCSFRVWWSLQGSFAVMLLLKLWCFQFGKLKLYNPLNILFLCLSEGKTTLIFTWDVIVILFLIFPQAENFTAQQFHSMEKAVGCFICTFYLLISLSFTFQSSKFRSSSQWC